MTDAFIAFVRHEEELLLLRRSKSDKDSPALWDGVYGIGDSEEDVLNRVAECTGRRFLASPKPSLLRKWFKLCLPGGLWFRAT